MTTVVHRGTSFVNRRMRFLMAALGFGLAVVLFGTTASAHGVGAKVSAGVLALLLLFVGVRAILSNFIDVGDTRLLVKSMLRTRSVAYTDLSSAQAITRPWACIRGSA